MLKRVEKYKGYMGLKYGVIIKYCFILDMDNQKKKGSNSILLI